MTQPGDNPLSGQGSMLPKSFPDLFDPPDVEVPVISLVGPFLPEAYAMRNLAECKKYICQLSKCNLTITRDIIVLTDDMEYVGRDDIRLELGLTHHLHNIELRVERNDFSVVGIDNFLLINPDDSIILKQYVDSFPLSVSELKSVHYSYLQ